MREMVIYGVSFDMVGKQPIVLLKTVDGNKFLPIWIGHPEAAAILMKLQGASTPRPMTHDLLTEILSELDARITRITVTELRENTFYAQVTVQLDGTEVEVDSRPSDAIALAIRAEAPIFAADQVIEESAIEFESEEEAANDERIRRVSGLGVFAPCSFIRIAAASGWPIQMGRKRLPSAVFSRTIGCFPTMSNDTP